MSDRICLLLAPGCLLLGLIILLWLGRRGSEPYPPDGFETPSYREWLSETRPIPKADDLGYALVTPARDDTYPDDAVEIVAAELRTADEICDYRIPLHVVTADVAGNGVDVALVESGFPVLHYASAKRLHVRRLA